MTVFTIFLSALLTFFSALTIYVKYPEYESFVLLTLPVIGTIMFVLNSILNLILKKLWH